MTIANLNKIDELIGYCYYMGYSLEFDPNSLWALTCKTEDDIIVTDSIEEMFDKLEGIYNEQAA